MTFLVDVCRCVCVCVLVCNFLTSHFPPPPPLLSRNDPPTTTITTTTCVCVSVCVYQCLSPQGVGATLPPAPPPTITTGVCGCVCVCVCIGGVCGAAGADCVRLIMGTWLFLSNFTSGPTLACVCVCVCVSVCVCPARRAASCKVARAASRPLKVMSTSFRLGRRGEKNRGRSAAVGSSLSAFTAKSNDSRRERHPACRPPTRWTSPTGPTSLLRNDKYLRRGHPPSHSAAMRKPTPSGCSPLRPRLRRSRPVRAPWLITSLRRKAPVCVGVCVCLYAYVNMVCMCVCVCVCVCVCM